MKWTSDRYLQLVEQGIFEGESVELLFGDILEKMSPAGSPHVNTIVRLSRELMNAFPTRSVGIQCTVRLSDDSVVDPDAWITKGHEDEYGSRGYMASDLVLVIEVADSSLRLDREIKQRAYALAGIPEYWIINVIDRVVEVYTEPVDGQYRVRLAVLPDTSIESPTLGTLPINTQRLFPKA